MLNKLGLYTHALVGNIQHELTKEDGSEIVQVVGMAACAAVIIGGMIAVAAEGGETIGESATNVLDTLVKGFGGN